MSALVELLLRRVTHVLDPEPSGWLVFKGNKWQIRPRNNCREPHAYLDLPLREVSALSENSMPAQAAN